MLETAIERRVRSSILQHTKVVQGAKKPNEPRISTGVINGSPTELRLGACTKRMLLVVLAKNLGTCCICCIRAASAVSMLHLLRAL
jgi:hypothetical protein